MRDITLPGYIPGLLRRCSPAMLGRTKFTAVGAGLAPLDADETARLLAIGVPVEDTAGPVAAIAGADGMFRRCPERMLALDLANATGRAHAAWWLASNFDLESATGCWHWGAYPHCRDCRNIVWSLITSNDGCLATFGTKYECDDPIVDERVPSLAHLDPNDPRTLPDGSRWVDAEALRLVCLQVHEQQKEGSR